MDSEVNEERHPTRGERAHTTTPKHGHGPTTHSAYGAGNPHLVLIGIERDGPSPEFPLGELTRIGSSPDNEIVLEGLLPHHATIEHTEQDQYSLDSLGQTETGSAGEASPFEDAPKGALLRHGTRFKIADYTFTFQREEYADHGRPFGGREGGEFEKQPMQDAPPDYSREHERAAQNEREERAARIESDRREELS